MTTEIITAIANRNGFDFNDLLRKQDIDPEQVVLLRHTPSEPKLAAALPRLAVERPDLYNAYQAAQSVQIERMMTPAKYIATFIGMVSGEAVFAGLYAIAGSKRITREEFWQIPENAELRDKYGIDCKPATRLWFDLQLVPFNDHWKGKLIVGYSKARSMGRQAKNGSFPVILGDSAFEPVISDEEFRQKVYGWDELNHLPRQIQAKLAETRGVYRILDTSDRREYVGAAYGEDNLLGRWKNYALNGHGGNVYLLERDPKNFLFSILERVSRDMQADDVIACETKWKKILSTYAPLGLNAK